MAQYELNVQSRTETGKGAARQLRMKNQLPAVLYGHHQDPIKFSVDRKEITDLVHHHGTNSLLVLTGAGNGETAFIKMLQKHWVRNEIQTVDFIRVSRNEQITVKVPVVLTGETVEMASGEGVLMQAIHELELTTTPANVPDSIEVDISHLELGGAAMNVGDITTIPEGVTLVTDPEETLAAVNLPAMEVEEDEVEEGEGEELETGDVNATEEQSGQGGASDDNSSDNSGSTNPE